MDWQARWHIGPDVVWADSTDEVRLYDGGFQTFNATAALVWRALVAGRTPESLVTELLTTFEASDPADAARIRADVEDFIADLDRRGLLVRDHSDVSAH